MWRRLFILGDVLNIINSDMEARRIRLFLKLYQSFPKKGYNSYHLAELTLLPSPKMAAFGLGVQVFTEN